MWRKAWDAWRSCGQDYRQNAGDVQAMLGLSLTLDLPHRTGTLRHGTSQLLLVSRARSARLRRCSYGVVNASAHSFVRALWTFWRFVRGIAVGDGGQGAVCVASFFSL